MGVPRFRFAATVLVLLVGSAGPRVASAQGRRLVGVSEVWGRYLAPQLPESGFLVALTARALSESGYTLDFSLYPWARALAMAKNGSADLLVGAYRTEERLSWFLFTDAVAEVPDSLFALRDRGISYRTLEDLKPYTIGVVRGAAHGTAFDGASFLRKEPSDSTLRNVQKLVGGRVDLIAGPRENILEALESHFPEHRDAVVALDPPLQVNSLHIAVPRALQDAPAIIEALNRGLARLRSDGTYARLEERYGIRSRF